MKTLSLHKFRPFAKFAQLSAQTLRNFEQKAAQSLGAAGCGVGGAARAPAGLETSAVVTRSGSRGGAAPRRAHREPSRSRTHFTSCGIENRDRVIGTLRSGWRPANGLARRCCARS
jgi:hypothetical protein